MDHCLGPSSPRSRSENPVGYAVLALDARGAGAARCPDAQASDRPEKRTGPVRRQCWEIAIKCSLGKLRLPEPVGEYVTSRVAAGHVRSLAIEHAHALAVVDLPP